MTTKRYVKQDFPVADVRRFLEPGPVVLVSSRLKGEANIMTMGWHMVMEFTPSLLGCCISSANHSFEMIRRSRECVINVPTADLAAKVVAIGNTSGRDVDKFASCGLTATASTRVAAPSIAECFANFECRLVDTGMVRKYNVFVFKVVAARVATSPRYPRTLHYRGDGVFMTSGTNTSRYRKGFRPEML